MVDRLHSVRLSAGALADLETIRTYRAEQRSPDEADQLIDTLIAHMGTLRDYPARGSIPPELDAWGVRDYRQLLHLPYRIIYSLIDEAVVVLLIADGRRDMKILLEQRLLIG